MRLKLNVDAEGGKLSVMTLKKEIEGLLSQYSCHYTIDLTDGTDITSTSVTIQKPEEISVEEIIDVELTGDQVYALLEHKE